MSRLIREAIWMSINQRGHMDVKIKVAGLHITFHITFMNTFPLLYLMSNFHNC